MPVSFKEILDAFDFVSMGGGEHQAFLCRQSGKIHWHSELSELGELEGELPDDMEDDENYVAIPDKRELDLGKPLALDFACQFLPRDFDEVRRIFGRRGAYASFKHLLARKRALEQWYDFERKATERALREWCELNSIELNRIECNLLRCICRLLALSGHIEASVRLSAFGAKRTCRGRRGRADLSGTAVACCRACKRQCPGKENGG